MSLNKFVRVDAQNPWMNVRCATVGADVIGGELVDAETVRCRYLEYEEIKPGLPVQTYFTNQFTQLLPTSPETNVLVNGVGSVAYTGNDKLGSETTITSLFVGTYTQNDTWRFRLKRGGKTLKTFQYVETNTGGVNATSIKWTITCNIPELNGKVLVQLEIKRGGLGNGITIEPDRYTFENIDDDLTAAGDLEFTIEPVSVVGVISELQHIQSSVVRRITY